MVLLGVTGTKRPNGMRLAVRAEAEHFGHEHGLELLGRGVQFGWLRPTWRRRAAVAQSGDTWFQLDPHRLAIRGSHPSQYPYIARAKNYDRQFAAEPCYEVSSGIAADRGVSRRCRSKPEAGIRWWHCSIAKVTRAWSTKAAGQYSWEENFADTISRPSRKRPLHPKERGPAECPPWSEQRDTSSAYTRPSGAHARRRAFPSCKSRRTWRRACLPRNARRRKRNAAAAAPTRRRCGAANGC